MSQVPETYPLGEHSNSGEKLAEPSLVSLPETNTKLDIIAKSIQTLPKHLIRELNLYWVTSLRGATHSTKSKLNHGHCHHHKRYLHYQKSKPMQNHTQGQGVTSTHSPGGVYT